MGPTPAPAMVRSAPPTVAIVQSLIPAVAASRAPSPTPPTTRTTMKVRCGGCAMLTSSTLSDDTLIAAASSLQTCAVRLARCSEPGAPSCSAESCASSRRSSCEDINGGGDGDEGGSARSVGGWMERPISEPAMPGISSRADSAGSSGDKEELALAASSAATVGAAANSCCSCSATSAGVGSTPTVEAGVART